MKQETVTDREILALRRKDFPLLSRKVHGKQLVYLDNASTTQKPVAVLRAMQDYYENYNANIHRGVYKISEEATIAYEQAHDAVAEFVHAKPEGTIFTRNATEAMNLVAYAWGLKNLKKEDIVLLTQMEHHSNLVPWQQIAKKTGAKLQYIPILKDGTLDIEAAERLIKNAKIVSLAHVSNVLGTINPIKKIAKIAHAAGVLCMVDAAQSVPHVPVDFADLDIDFMAFSGHKLYGPTGTGVLCAKPELLEAMDPFLYGGDMISSVDFFDTKWNELPWKYEAGTANIAGGIGLMAAVQYLQKTGMERIARHEQQLAWEALERLKEVPKLTLYGPEESRAAVISFNLANVHAHDVAQVLDTEGICIRGGHHCAQPLMSVLGVPATSRASFGIYNIPEEIDSLLRGIEKVKKVFHL